MLTKDEAEIVEAAIIYAYRIGRGSGNRSDAVPDALWTMLLGSFPDLRMLLPPGLNYEILRASREGGST